MAGGHRFISRALRSILLRTSSKNTSILTVRSFAVLIVLVGLPGPALAAIQYQYDSLGHLVQTTYDNGVVVRYFYDAAGNRSQVIIAETSPNQSPAAPNDTVVTVPAPTNIMALVNDRDPNGQAVGSLNDNGKKRQPTSSSSLWRSYK